MDHNGHVVRRWRLVMGCDPYTGLGLCDKAMSGFCIDGFVGRFAAAPSVILTVRICTYVRTYK